MKRMSMASLAVVVLIVGCGGADATQTTAPLAAPETTVGAPTTVAPTTTATTMTSTTTTTTTAAPTTTTTTTTTVAPTTTTTAPTTTTSTAAPTTTTAAVDYVAWGAELATTLGCGNCHSTDGSVGLGPSWAGLAGSTVTLTDGSTVAATNSYIEESIRAPDAKIVAGFNAGLMQSSYNSLSNDEIRALVAYVASR